MPLTDDQQRLVDEVGETDDGRLAANVVAVLAVWAGKDLIKPGLTRLYAKRQLIDLAMGAVRSQVDFSDAQGLTVKAGQRGTRLQAMQDTTLAEIIRLEAKARGRRLGASQELVTKAPAMPPWPTPPFPDANDPRLNGDPYKRPLYGRDSGIP
jgi:hypothetical protein